MRQTALCFLFAAIFFQQKCDLRQFTADGIRNQALLKVQAFFPNAKVLLNQQTGTVAALTCTQGVSLQFATTIGQYLANDRDMMRSLGYLSFSGVTGVSYKYFVLVFDGGEVWYFVDQRRLFTEVPNSAMQTVYRQQCGF